MESIQSQMKMALSELFHAARALKPGDIIVVGCSTSEVVGNLIGTTSSQEVARAIMDVLLPEVRQRNLHLAVQCCEHLNRALVVEEETMNKFDFQEVWVRPQLHAGGAMAVEATKAFNKPRMVENIASKATIGIDIGDTFIGMHLRPVVVPVHTSHRRIGQAHLSMAYTRPKYIGGERAAYDGIEKNENVELVQARA